VGIGNNHTSPRIEKLGQRPRSWVRRFGVGKEDNAVAVCSTAVAVDDADNDDDGHARERRQGEHQPAVLEAEGARLPLSVAKGQGSLDVPFACSPAQTPTRRAPANDT